MVQPARRGTSTTSAQIIDTAVTLRPKLLLRAREICGSRSDLDAEDLVGATFLKLVSKPPTAESETKLLHWMRTVMLRIWLDIRHREDELEVVSYEAEFSRALAR